MESSPNPPKMKGYTIVDADEFVIDHSVERECMGPEKTYAHLNIPKALGEFNLESITARNFSLHQLSLTCNHNLLLRSASSQKSEYCIAWMTSGRDIVSFDASDVEAVAGKSAFLFHPSEVEVHRFEPNRKNETFLLEINPGYFEEQLFNEDSFTDGTISKLKHSALRKEFVYAGAPLHSLQNKIIADIKNCPLNGSLGEMMLEGSVQQIIALQLSSLATGFKKEASIKAQDREIIHAVREYLDNSFEQDHSLRDLKKMFGINSCKLKKYFKEVVGVPVIQYVYDLKMTHAKTLLRENTMNVSEVAYKVGYRHAHHFTTAFKKKFGVSPSRMR